MDKNNYPPQVKRLQKTYPYLVKEVIGWVTRHPKILSKSMLDLICKDILWGFSQEQSFGEAITHGYQSLINCCRPEQLHSYHIQIKDAGRQGPNQGKYIAIYIAPVIATGDQVLLDQFLNTVHIMLQKGLYTLKSPLDFLAESLNRNHYRTCKAFLELLNAVFSLNLSYRQCQSMAINLPRAIRQFPTHKRWWQTQLFTQVVQTDIQLVDAFIDGMQKGLHTLSRKALTQFLSTVSGLVRQNLKKAQRFLALDSQIGSSTFSGLQVAVPLNQIQSRLNRYLQARTGLSLSVSPQPNGPEPLNLNPQTQPTVYSDGRFIYLPAEISQFATRSKNEALYKCLTKMEACFYEFGTYNFDLEKAQHRIKKAKINPDFLLPQTKLSNPNFSDLVSFFNAFANPSLAHDLFTIFEHGRIAHRLKRIYPGILRQIAPFLKQELLNRHPTENDQHPLVTMYTRLLLGNRAAAKSARNHADQWIASIIGHTRQLLAQADSVETCALLTFCHYQSIVSKLNNSENVDAPPDGYQSLAFPFDCRLRPDLIFCHRSRWEKMAQTLKHRLAAKGIHVYKSDLTQNLAKNDGRLASDDVLAAINKHSHETASHPIEKAIKPIDINNEIATILADQTQIITSDPQSGSGSFFWYKEWDFNLGDYLNRHVKVSDQVMPGSEGDFFEQTLQKHSNLIRHIRYLFELLRPEGLKLLRQWVEGDAFDYRALLDFAVDRRAGIIPSDRLYIKRIKKQRDVAVLLLVDISRSTRNIVHGARESVLEVEKEAIVLFCEALRVVGDAFAIAGFSGNSRLGVDYYRIKDFGEPLTTEVHARITGMQPQRNTRLGAAIRHATAELESFPAKFRLLLILSDGFPNDLGYKKKYAVEDTRKAVLEARSKTIHVKGVTVDIAGDSRLKDLYDEKNHSAISDIQQLPDKLVHIYSSLTR